MLSDDLEWCKVIRLVRFGLKYACVTQGMRQHGVMLQVFRNGFAPIFTGGAIFQSVWFELCNKCSDISVVCR